MNRLILFSIFIFAAVGIYAQTLIGTLNGLVANDRFGATASLNAQGNVLAIGAPSSSDSGLVYGLVQVFENQAGSWISKGNPISGDTISDHFGNSVKLDYAGNTMVVGSNGSMRFNPNFLYKGFTRVFDFVNGNWQQRGGDFIGTNYSYSGSLVDISADGNTIAITEPGHSSPSVSQCGRVRVFHWANNQWLQKGSGLVGSSPRDFAGQSLALSGDGNTVAVGMPQSQGNMGHLASPGKLNVYEWNGSTWTQQGQTFLGSSTGFEFGISVDLSYDGKVMVVGHGNITLGSPNLEVYHFNAVTSSWQLRGGSFIPSLPDGPYGDQVSISHDGMVIAAGDPNFTIGTNYSIGAVRIYEYASGNWYQRGNNVNGKTPYGGFGQTLALDSSGSIFAGGSYFPNATTSGFIEVYDMNTLVGHTEASLKQAKKLSIYPNPFSQTTQLNIEHGSFELLEVFNLKGQLVHTQRLFNNNALQLDLSQEENGIYLIRLSSPNGKSTTLKAVKQ